MGKFDKYKIDLKGMGSNHSSYDVDIDNVFFANIDGPEVSKGKAKIHIDVKKNSAVYDLRFSVQGVVQVTCDRCLDDMDVEIDTTGELQVKLGNDYGEQGNIVIIPESEGVINVAWYIYEFVALAIPMKHVHAPGKCNKEMTGKLNKHLIRTDEEGEVMEESAEFEESENVEPETDPRWDELKKIIDNN